MKALVEFHLLFRAGDSIWFRGESLLGIDWCGAGISWVRAVSFGVGVILRMRGVERVLLWSRM